MIVLEDLLASDGYFLYNKRIGRELGFDCAVLIGELYNKYVYYKKENKLEDGMFYLTRECIEHDTGMSHDFQRSAMKKLQNAEILIVKRKGVPSKNFYKINEEVLIKFLSDDSQRSKEISQSSVSATTRNPLDGQQEIGLTDTINNNIINKEHITNNIKGIIWNSTERHIEFTNDVFSFDILEKQIIKCFNNLYPFGYDKDTLEDVIYIIKYYYVAFYRTFKEHHIIISNNAMEGVIERLMDGSERTSDFGIDKELYEDLIGQHFMTRYKNCDYSICHFMTEGIRNNRAYETGY